ncbi:hypothetical protein NO559_00585 [Dasania sp. GY-MA-18]|uniref:Uncharacterized protein n=1 Tax=Dasania phycosphaerae TaxID=2950436 RepID=A0A9J6RH70_9GAMM|nr:MULTISPECIES: hypothetical protein [Dasania]MCR8921245.1 hypothetical protein [Dasania sp. GY-MA-18]MCZ0863673.1 hypothetical protein [Dasania phycosphaerae]MCZ0867401.1 hypothetical protein [Dasania phycosphaerae]
MVYALSWSKDVLSVKLAGVINADTLMAMADEVARDYRYDDLRKRIYDCTAVTCFNLSLHDLKSFVHIDSAAFATNPNAHIAIVTASDSVAKTIALYQQRFVQTPWRLKVFKSLPEAQAWECVDSALGLVAEPSPNKSSE